MNKVYAVACYDNYYPIPDNVRKVFSNEKDAYQYLEELREVHRAKDCVYDCYEVFDYVVE